MTPEAALLRLRTAEVEDGPPDLTQRRALLAALRRSVIARADAIAEAASADFGHRDRTDTLLAEVLLVAARAGDLPQVFARTNAKDVPVGALTLSTALVQVLLVVVLFAADAFDVALNLTSALALIPYFLTAGFALKLALTDPGQPSPARRAVTLAVAVLATAYTGFLLYAAGAEYTLLSLLIIVPATVLYAAARRARGERVFTRGEWALFAVAAAGAIAAAVLIATGVLVI